MIFIYTTTRHSLPNEFLQLLVAHIVRADFVLALVHGPVHAGLKECAGRSISANRDILVELVDVALQIAPYEIGLAIRFPATEFEVFRDEERLFLVGCGIVSEEPVYNRTSRVLSSSSSNSS
jgi:hypothetical protein